MIRVIIIIIIIVIITDVDWVFVDNIYYRFYTTPTTSWTNAKQNCVQQGAKLVAMETPEELDLIRNFINRNHGRGLIIAYISSEM